MNEEKIARLKKQREDTVVIIEQYKRAIKFRGAALRSSYLAGSEGVYGVYHVTINRIGKSSIAGFKTKTVNPLDATPMSFIEAGRKSKVTYHNGLRFGLIVQYDAVVLAIKNAERRLNAIDYQLEAHQS